MTSPPNDVVVVHPGVQHSADLAFSLLQGGRLHTLVTRLQVGVGAGWPLGTGAARKRLPRRVSPVLPDHYIRRRGVFDEFALRLLARRGKQTWAEWWERRSARRFERATVRSLGPEVRAVVATDTAALSLFTRLAKDRPDIGRVLDVSHPLDTVVQPLIAEDAAALGVPLTAYDDYREGPPTSQLEELRSADVVMVASQFTASTIEAAGGPLDRVEVVPYAVHVADIRPRREAQRDSLRLLALGAMSERKGMSSLLRTMERLAAAAEPVHLTVAGRSSPGYRLPGELPDNVQYAGAPDAAGVAELFRSSDVLVLPSMCEGFGRTLLEALAGGMSVITTERSGGPDILRAAPSAPLIVVPVGERDRLEGVVLDHLRHPEKYLRPEAARAAASQFSTERYREGLERAIDTAILRAQDRRREDPS